MRPRRKRSRRFRSLIVRASSTATKETLRSADLLDTGSERSVTSATTYSQEFADTPLWLSHHHREQRDRCIRVGRLHVCRRCLIVYPIVVATAAICAVIGVAGSVAATVVVAVSLVPFIVDWCADHLGMASYSARRSALVSAVGAVGLGLALGIHARSPLDPWTIAPVVVVCVVAFTTVVVGRIRRGTAIYTANDWETSFTVDEADRQRRLRDLLGPIEDLDG